MKYKKILYPLLSLAVILFFSFLPQFTLAGQIKDYKKLKQELTELEKYTKPFIQVFRKVSQLVGPSVVSLRMEKKDLPRFDETLKPPLPHEEFQPEEEPHPGDIPRRMGMGSGIIVQKNGYILTNHHVISGFSEDEITVVTHDGEQYNNVKLIGIDPTTDLAIIKIEGNGFLPAKFGDAEKVEVGDWVLAIGSPFGYQQTVSVGIISAKGRTHVIPFIRPFIYEDFFQTDAAINPGNSGGPLVNLKGEVVGINTAIATRSGGFQGVGFAISSSIAKETAENIIATGTVIRGYLGVGTHNIDNDLASVLGLKGKKEIVSYFSLPSEKGAFVLEVWQDTPASKAGILPGDVILEIDGKTIENTVDLQHAIRHAKVATNVPVRIIRDGKEILLNVFVEQQPEDLAGKTYVAIQRLDKPKKFSFGLIVNDLHPEIAKTLGLEGLKGVLVVDVEKGSSAADAGIQPGDLILKVGAKDVGSVAEFMALINEFMEQSGTVTVFVKDKGFVTLK